MRSKTKWNLNIEKTSKTVQYVMLMVKSIRSIHESSIYLTDQDTDVVALKNDLEDALIEAIQKKGQGWGRE